MDDGLEGTWYAPAAPRPPRRSRNAPRRRPRRRAARWAPHCTSRHRAHRRGRRRRRRAPHPRWRRGAGSAAARPGAGMRPRHRRCGGGRGWRGVAAARRRHAGGSGSSHQALEETVGRARRRAVCRKGQGAAAGWKEPAGHPPRTTPRTPLGRTGLGDGTAAQRRVSGAASGAMGVHRQAAVRRHRRLPRTFRPTRWPDRTKDASRRCLWPQKRASRHVRWRQRTASGRSPENMQQRRRMQAK